MVVDVHLQAQARDPQNNEVTVDDSMAAGEVLPATAKHHLPVKVSDLDPELAPLVRPEPDDVRELDCQPLFITDNPQMELSPRKRFLLEELSDSNYSDVETLLENHREQMLVMALAARINRWP
ncbi:Cell division cycle 5-like protein [Hordeum vulgare]|nr:Cell division cycle 5-like protein [Hordeum vulgare]